MYVLTICMRCRTHGIHSNYIVRVFWDADQGDCRTVINDANARHCRSMRENQLAANQDPYSERSTTVRVASNIDRWRPI
jgi:hypothetical protein